MAGKSKMMLYNEQDSDYRVAFGKFVTVSAWWIFRALDIQFRVAARWKSLQSELVGLFWMVASAAPRIRHEFESYWAGVDRLGFLAVLVTVA